MGEGEPDSSNGAKSRNPEWLCSHIRIKTLHALIIVVSGMVAWSGFFWMEFKELKEEVKEVEETATRNKYSILTNWKVSTWQDPSVEEDEELQNEIHRQNSE